MPTANALAQVRYRAAHTELVRDRDRKRMRAKIRAIRRYKRKKGCARCGERDPDVLQLHHVDPSEKNERLVFRAAKRTSRQGFYNLGWKALQVELPRCVVLCANCHSRHEARLRRAHHHEG